jgi:outer membrane immunogenic protein
MKRHLLALAAVAISSVTSAALGADVSPPGAPAPVYRAPPAPLSYNWSGFYLGANVGYGRVNSNSAVTFNSPFFGVATTTSTGTANGVIAGGQVGANWQMGMFVLGAEGDFQWSNQKSTTNTGCGLGCTVTEVASVDSFGTARLRVGGAFDRVLVYVTGGGAWTNASDNLSATAFGTTATLVNLTASKVGWTVGSGIDFAVLDNLIARAEYLYISTSNITNTAPVSALLGGGTITETAQLKDSIVRFGLSYKFGGGSTVAARY